MNLNFNFLKKAGAVKLALLIFVVFILPLPAMAASNNDLPAIMETIQAYYKDMKSMTADFTQTFVHKESRNSETRKGVLKFKKPLFVSWDVKGKDRELLIINNNEIWDYLADEEVAYRYPLVLVEDDNSFIKMVTGQSNMKEDFEVSLEGVEAGVANLHLYPKKPTQQLTEAYLSVDVKSGALTKLTVFDFFGNENQVVFTKTATDVRLPDSAFRFTPPRGVDVEDRMEATPQTEERTLFQ